MQKTEIKIFVVEDEIIVANDIKNLLLLNGFNVVGLATKYKEAIEGICNHQPDLILCDINLRDTKSGIQLIQELSEKLRFKIIFISAYSDLNTIKAASKLDPSNYLTKPFNHQQLLTSVHMALHSIELVDSDTQKPSKRQLEIISLLSQGYTNKEIGEKLFISELTVKTHRRNLLKKLGLKNTAELVTFSFSQNWI